MTRRSRTCGFTLLELLAVVTVLALVAAAATLKLGGVYQRARLKQGVAAVEAFDGWTRRHASARRAPGVLKMAVGTRRAWLESGSSDDTLPSLVLPEGVVIARVAAPREDREHGEVAVRISSLGGSETYAVQLETSGGLREWLAFAGVTGQRIDIENERNTEGLLRALKKNRFDAD